MEEAYKWLKTAKRASLLNPYESLLNLELNDLGLEKTDDDYCKLNQMFDAEEIIKRRRKLMELVPSLSATVIVYGRNVLMRSPGIQLKFYHHSDLTYLTGYDRHNGILVLEKDINKKTSNLFIPKPDVNYEIQHGEMLTFDEVKRIANLDNVLPLSEFNDWVNRNIPANKVCFCSFPPGQSGRAPFTPLGPVIDQLRLIKSKTELDFMKKAREISIASVDEALKHAAPNILEMEIDMSFQKEATSRGATGFAFPTIAASGESVLFLSYLRNTRRMQEGDLLLFNAGAEYNHYGCSITKTVPIGDTTRARKDMLSMVEGVKDALVKIAKRGDVGSLDMLQAEAEALLRKGLHEFNISAEGAALKKIFPHHVSHWVGLDIHDTPTVPLSTPLRSGMAFTVEPGLYFQQSNIDVPEEFRGLGCRFEDTVILD